MSSTYAAPPAPTTAFTLNSAATTNLTSVKATAGTLHSILCSNIGAAVAFVKLYNKASAPVLATDVPVLTISVAANGVVSVDSSMGIPFTLGIALAITNGAADTDIVAVAAAQVKVTGAYL